MLSPLETILPRRCLRPHSRSSKTLAEVCSRPQTKIPEEVSSVLLNSSNSRELVCSDNHNSNNKVPYLEHLLPITPKQEVRYLQVLEALFLARTLRLKLEVCSVPPTPNNNLPSKPLCLATSSNRLVLSSLLVRFSHHLSNNSKTSLQIFFQILPCSKEEICPCHPRILTNKTRSPAC